MAKSYDDMSPEERKKERDKLWEEGMAKKNKNKKKSNKKNNQ